MLNLQAAQHVQYRFEEPGGVVLLDTAAGIWMALNPTAGAFWRRWQSGVGFEESVAQVALQHPGIPLALIRADAEQLVRDLYSHGLIEPIRREDLAEIATEMAESEVLHEESRPGWLRVGAAVIAIAMASVLTRCSFRMSLGLVRMSRRAWCRRAATPRQAATTVAAVSLAARRYPGRAACLERSLAAVLLCALRRRRLDWCLGSASNPYRFHAWVEVHEGTTGVSQSGHVRVLVA